MTTPAKPPRASGAHAPRGFAFEVNGFKSFRDAQRFDLRPLTILAGTNSSGKSSAMQPLLLLKQTLDATIDPGPLKLTGPNVRFSEAEQLFWSGRRQATGPQRISVTLLGGHDQVGLTFDRADRGLELGAVHYSANGRTTELKASMSAAEMAALRDFLLPTRPPAAPDDARLTVLRQRCQFVVNVASKDLAAPAEPRLGNVTFIPLAGLDRLITGIIHLPGLRGNPERSYSIVGTGPTFDGTFPPYTASVLAAWKDANDARLRSVGEDLSTLHLTWKVDPVRLGDTAIELRVGRLQEAARGGAHDTVNIADVGLGVSQSLPIVVALRVAEPGQIVFVEQPELHLHPSAQVAMAGVLLAAAERGVIVVAETHSDLLILAVQAAIARREHAANLVKLYWFDRDREGATTAIAAELDEHGAFGDWPVDFADVRATIERRYLDASFPSAPE